MPSLFLRACKIQICEIWRISRQLLTILQLRQYHFTRCKVYSEVWNTYTSFEVKWNKWAKKVTTFAIICLESQTELINFCSRRGRSCKLFFIKFLVSVYYNREKLLFKLSYTCEGTGESNNSTPLVHILNRRTKCFWN